MSLQTTLAATLSFGWMLSLPLEATESRFAVTGAEIAGNSNGSIPSWQGKTATPLPGWVLGKDRSDFSPYKDELPTMQIDRANSETHKHFLSQGQLELLNSKSGYTMPVYPTRRSCGFPDFVMENTRRFYGQARIAPNGWSIENATLPSVPFPQPRSGIEAIWNFLLAYTGVGAEWTTGISYLSPHSPGADPVRYDVSLRLHFPWAAPGAMHIAQAPYRSGVTYTYRAPASLAGQAIAQRYYFDRPPESFYYFPAQRRVRRMSSYTHDAWAIGFEKTYPVDAQLIFSGNPDRFHWTLQGKRELYLPYNSFSVTETDSSGKSVFEREFISATARRYELHRVWVVEGRLKPGLRHSTPRKLLYLDEDSWLAVIGEDYDGENRLVRYKESSVIPIWEIGACSTIAGLIIYDFTQNRYIRDGLARRSNDFRFFAKPDQPWMHEHAFGAEGLRMQGN
jgi:hypothetical protein